MSKQLIGRDGGGSKEVERDAKSQKRLTPVVGTPWDEGLDVRIDEDVRGLSSRQHVLLGLTVFAVVLMGCVVAFAMWHGEGGTLEKAFDVARYIIFFVLGWAGGRTWNRHEKD